MSVVVVGEGFLAELLYEELSAHYETELRNDLTTDFLKGIELVLVVSDDGHPPTYLQAEEVLHGAGVPWLSGFVTYGEGVVGPFVRPATPGCSKCADQRRHMARRNSPEELEEIMNRLLSPDEPTSSKGNGLPRTGLMQMVHLLTAEADRVLQDLQSHLEEHVYLIHLATLKTSLHFFLPDPLCPVCSLLLDDSPEAARLSLKPNPKPHIDHYRARPLDELERVLTKDYMDPRTGLFNDKWHHFVSPFTNVSVNLPTLVGSEITGGRSHSFAESELIAILEGLERYCGMNPLGKRTVIHDSFRNVAEQALDPLKVGVYSAEQYALSDFPFEPFDPDHKIDWVWGYSLGEERPILVPQQLAYYSWGHETSFVKETSNGCALGGSMEEAILYGILEVVERDSFLMTWYAKLPVPQLDPFTAQDLELKLMLERLQTVAGYDVLLFNTTTENGIPSIWALALNRKPTGPNLVCAAGAHLDPVRAVKSAIHELSNTILMLHGKYEDGYEECEAMYKDPYLVQQLEDHSMLYGLPQAEERLQFLLGGDRPIRSFSEEFEPPSRHADLTDDLKDVLRTFRRLGHDVIVVDQTSPETRRNGLYCVKVLIPGMLPITFGHHLVRLTGLERVYRIPVELGYADQPLTAEQLNPYPHPFP